MEKRLRLLLDTNILIPLHDSSKILDDSLTNLIRLVNSNSHQFVIHPANLADIARDSDKNRRQQILQRLKQHEILTDTSPCPWNIEDTTPNDACDNSLIYAIHCDAAHALITEDKGIHKKAQKYKLKERVYTIQEAEDWLNRLHPTKSISFQNIIDIPLHSLTGKLKEDFFNSLREDYPEFDTWFRSKAREGRKAWVYRDNSGSLQAICIYQKKENEKINDKNEVLDGTSLKLCTFKVAPACQGRKIVNFFLKLLLILPQIIIVRIFLLQQ